MVLWLGCVIETRSHLQSVAEMESPESSAQEQWRYTKYGWERCDDWLLPNAEQHGQRAAQLMHPVIVALLELLIVLGALAASVPSNAFAGSPDRHETVLAVGPPSSCRVKASSCRIRSPSAHI